MSPFNLCYYTTDNSLPWIQDCVVYGEASDPDTTFEGETSGISPHPASSSSESIDQQDFLMENMKISDPENSHSTGWSCRIRA